MSSSPSRFFRSASRFFPGCRSDGAFGNTASIAVTGSTFDIRIAGPDRQEIIAESNATTFSYDLTAQKAGEHRIEITNNGSTSLEITGHAQTKSSPLGLAGALMLAVTGIIVIGLGLRFRKH